jgi:hypothetical protein
MRYIIHYFNCDHQCVDHAFVDQLEMGLIWPACSIKKCDGMYFIPEEINPVKTVDCELISVVRDGGTKVLQDIDNRVYYVDGRIGTKTPGVVFDRYPRDEGAQQLDVKINIVLCQVHHRKYSKYSPILP